MVLRKLMGIFAVTLIVCGASFATAGIPDLEESEATAETAGALSLFCLADGQGDTFDLAWVKGGVAGAPVQADATITLFLRDGGGFPVPNFPAEDLYLQWNDESTLLVCVGGTIADADTDVDGITDWNDALLVGGYSESLVKVYVVSDALTSSAGLPLSVNSADINKDNIVDLGDVGEFAIDFASGVTYRSDFVSDNVLNIADVGKLASGLGATCP